MRILNMMHNTQLGIWYTTGIRRRNAYRKSPDSFTRVVDNRHRVFVCTYTVYITIYNYDYLHKERHNEYLIEQKEAMAVLTISLQSLKVSKKIGNVKKKIIHSFVNYNNYQVLKLYTLQRCIYRRVGHLRCCRSLVDACST